MESNKLSIHIMYGYRKNYGKKLRQYKIKADVFALEYLKILFGCHENKICCCISS